MKVSMNNKKTVTHIFSKYAKQYQDKYMNIAMYKTSLNVFCDAINNDTAEILELGCGPGNITQYLLSKNPNYNVFGIDLSESMIALARINNSNAKFETMDCRDISQLNLKYDAIMCGFCLPYLSKIETKKLIHDANDLLKPNGVMYISTMEDDYNKSGLQGPSSGGPDKIYIYYHHREYLTQMLNECSFNIIDLSDINNPDVNRPNGKDILIIAKK